jgi:4-hydroxy-tetrahydrodipicolinate reductase
MRLLLLGYGRMGRIVDGLSAEYGMEVVGRVDPVHGESPETWPAADVAIDFSVASAVPGNVRRLGAQGTSVVIGTTGWSAEEAAVRREAAAAGIGVVAAANFALGVNLFLALTERVAELMAPHGEFGAWIHEAHHAAKRDAPSGTALSLEAALRTRGYDRPLDVSSTRAGSIPGTHTVGFDAASETITLTHSARDRSGFARGALQAARWVHGRSGWFSMRDVLGL